MARKASPQHARAAALAIVRTLREAGHVAFFAGGCVRDELLGLAPTDYDIATDATPDRISRIFQRTNEVGAAFGVVLVTLGPREGLPAQATVEVATFRSEGPYSDRRRPDRVSFSDPRSDALRRDFTVNGLFLDPLPGPGGAGVQRAGSDLESPPDRIPLATPEGGEAIDFVGGMQDLQQRVIRAVGDPEQRLAEDHLRALRAVRLSARLGFALDPATARAIHRHARDLEGVSRERIGDELRRMLGHPSRAAAIAKLQELALDAPVLQEPTQTPPLRALGALQAREMLEPSFGTCLAAWAMDRGLALESQAIQTLTARWREALCLSNPESDQLRAILNCLAALVIRWDSASIARRKRLAGQTEGFSEALRILLALDPPRAAAIDREVGELAATPSGLAPPAFVSGDQLVAAGYRPGPAFKLLLDAAYDAQLEGRVKSPEEAMELIRNLRI